MIDAAVTTEQAPRTVDAGTSPDMAEVVHACVGTNEVHGVSSLEPATATDPVDPVDAGATTVQLLLAEAVTQTDGVHFHDVATSTDQSAFSSEDAVSPCIDPGNSSGQHLHDERVLSVITPVRQDGLPALPEKVHCAVQTDSSLLYEDAVDTSTAAIGQLVEYVSPSQVLPRREVVREVEVIKEKQGDDKKWADERELLASEIRQIMWQLTRHAHGRTTKLPDDISGQRPAELIRGAVDEVDSLRVEKVRLEKAHFDRSLKLERAASAVAIEKVREAEKLALARAVHEAVENERVTSAARIKMEAQRARAVFNASTERMLATEKDAASKALEKALETERAKSAAAVEEAMAVQRAALTESHQKELQGEIAACTLAMEKALKAEQATAASSLEKVLQVNKITLAIELDKAVQTERAAAAGSLQTAIDAAVASAVERAQEDANKDKEAAVEAAVAHARSGQGESRVAEVIKYVDREVIKEVQVTKEVEVIQASPVRMTTILLSPLPDMKQCTHTEEERAVGILNESAHGLIGGHSPTDQQAISNRIEAHSSQVHHTTHEHVMAVRATEPVHTESTASILNESAHGLIGGHSPTNQQAISNRIEAHSSQVHHTTHEHVMAVRATEPVHTESTASILNESAHGLIGGHSPTDQQAISNQIEAHSSQVHRTAHEHVMAVRATELVDTESTASILNESAHGLVGGHSPTDQQVTTSQSITQNQCSSHMQVTEVPSYTLTKQPERPPPTALPSPFGIGMLQRLHARVPKRALGMPSPTIASHHDEANRAGAALPALIRPPKAITARHLRHAPARPGPRSSQSPIPKGSLSARAVLQLHETRSVDVQRCTAHDIQVSEPGEPQMMGGEADNSPQNDDFGTDALAVVYRPENERSKALAACQPIKLSLAVEDECVAAAHECATLALVSVAVPRVPPKSRPRLEICAVVDNSGSMEGEKLVALRSSLHFLVRHCLQDGDHMGLVSFDEDAHCDFPLGDLDSIARQRLLHAIETMRGGGKTNLSAGLVAGALQLCSSMNCGSSSQEDSAGAASGNVTRALLLFTDDKANRGTTRTPAIIDEVREALRPAGNGVAVFTFGYGADHNDVPLRAIADAFGGRYFFIERPCDIVPSFSECLGGIASTVAHNATLLLEGCEGQSWLGQPLISGYHLSTNDDNHLQLSIHLGNLYAEERKDLPITLHLPAVAGSGSPVPVLRAQLTYTAAISDTQTFEQLEAVQWLTREPATTAKRAQSSSEFTPKIAAAADSVTAVALSIDAQRCRLGALSAIEEATRLAESGRLDLARSALKESAMLASRAASADSPQVQQLVSDLSWVAAGFEDQQTYLGIGKKRSAMTRMSHLQQRSTHMTGSAYTRRSASTRVDVQSGTNLHLPEVAIDAAYVEGYLSGYNSVPGAIQLPLVENTRQSADSPRTNLRKAYEPNTVRRAPTLELGSCSSRSTTPRAAAVRTAGPPTITKTARGERSTAKAARCSAAACSVGPPHTSKFGAEGHALLPSPAQGTLEVGLDLPSCVDVTSELYRQQLAEDALEQLPKRPATVEAPEWGEGRRGRARLGPSIFAPPLRVLPPGHR